VFNCRNLLDQGCFAGKYPIVVLIETPHNKPTRGIAEAADEGCLAYRVVRFSVDYDRDFTDMTLQSMDWVGFTAMRRGLKIAQVIGC